MQNLKNWIAAACLLLVAGYAPLAPAMTVVPTGQMIAERYGIDGWDQIQQIEFTFNVQLPGRDGVVTRQWRWDIANQQVTRTVADEAISIALGPASDDRPDEWEQVHSQYINDSYWLLFPFQLVWSDPRVTDEGDQPLPIGEGEARKYTCQWPDEGGYTPGDAYDLYLGPDRLIKQWVFRRGGGESGSAHTWNQHRQLGPIIVSLDHRNADDTFRLWFTDVQATLTDGTVVTPQPLPE
jgi:hypothetical protein